MKRAFEAVAVSSGLCTVVRGIHRDAVLILAYHNILPDDASGVGDSSLHVPRKRFAEQLDALGEIYDVVPLSGWQKPRRGGSRPRAVVTIDDAYRGAVTVGVAELVRRGMPATIFAPAGLLGGRTFWWDELAPRHGPMHPRVRDYLLDELGGCRSSIMAWAERQGRCPRSFPEHATTASKDELLAASRNPEITVASHAWSHGNLACLSYSEIRAELERARDDLQSLVGDAWVPWLAYPYGRTSENARRAARETGHEGALLVDGGLAGESASAERHRFAVPRVNVPADVSRENFLMRAAGLL